ncbi:hypothetical protein C1J03_24170 (plasmid) [Sulfitobacter sp. SK012]|uniref:DUF6854 domain-containing protein n=1 Tax=Sulfitobacter sp. SK012 TaxID=1389005 RepID=UPI000E0C0FC3|nr:hypothetical protein [Sulfitobacter sp. SK012]AXI49197.1 hypothetical protein C1J03_24170 [Sulfitobacter sp. SK012]
MTSPKYMMITVAKCAPQQYDHVIEHLNGLASDLKKGAGAATTRHGIIATGEHTGQIILFQTYAEMNGIDRAFGVYETSSAYKGLVHDLGISVTLRNILRIEDVGLQNPSSNVPAYGVVTRTVSPGLDMDKMVDVVPHFEKSGAMVFRYCTILTGTAAGHRLLVAGYPSMDAIEKTYDSLRGSAEYNAVLETHEVEWRNIIRITG